MSLTEARQGRRRGRKLEAEVKQTKFEAEARRPPEKNPLSPRYIAMQNLVALSQTVNGLVAPPSWVEVIYVIPLYEVSRGLNLNLRSMGRHSLKLTDYYQAEARRYLPDRAKTEAETMRQSRGRGSKVETEARPCEAEPAKKTASRPPRAEADQDQRVTATPNRQPPNRSPNPTVPLTQLAQCTNMSMNWHSVSTCTIALRNSKISPATMLSRWCWYATTEVACKPSHLAH